MADLFFSFDGQNYAMYRTFFSVFLTNIEETHLGDIDLLRMGSISVARSFVPGSQWPVDKTIEEIFMRHAKYRAGPESTMKHIAVGPALLVCRCHAPDG